MMIPTRENAMNQSQLLPTGWEQAYDAASNRIFYVDHSTRTTTWLNPIDRLSKPKIPMECHDDQLPYGWERINDPRAGTYYANHLERRNQWANPVDDWRFRITSQHHYSNSQHVFNNMEQSGNSLDSNNQTTSQTTADTKPEISDMDDKFTTSLNNSNTLSTDIIDTMRSNNSTRGSRHDAGLLDIMDNCFGRKSSQSVEV